jgi:hypothetical protein
MTSLIEDEADKYADRFTDEGHGAIAKLGFMQCAQIIREKCQGMTFSYSKPPMRAVTCHAVNILDIEALFEDDAAGT